MCLFSLEARRELVCNRILSVEYNHFFLFFNKLEAGSWSAVGYNSFSRWYLSFNKTEYSTSSTFVTKTLIIILDNNWLVSLVYATIFWWTVHYYLQFVLLKLHIVYNEPHSTGWNVVSLAENIHTKNMSHVCSMVFLYGYNISLTYSHTLICKHCFILVN